MRKFSAILMFLFFCNLAEAKEERDAALKKNFCNAIEAKESTEQNASLKRFCNIDNAKTDVVTERPKEKVEILPQPNKVVKKEKQNVAAKKNPKRFSAGLRLGYSKNKFVFDTPAAHSILSWRDMKGFSGGVDLGAKITDNVDLLFEYSYTKVSGDGTDDDVQNVGLQNGSDHPGPAYSAQKARGHVTDYSLVANFDLYKTSSMKISPRIGYFYKYAKLGMYEGWIYDTGTIDNIDGLGQLTRSRYYGPKVGFKLEKSFFANSTEALIFDYYILPQYSGRQLWPQRQPQDMHWTLQSVNGRGSLGRNQGLMARAEHIMRISDSLSAKIYGFYEYIAISKLTEADDVNGKSSWSRNNAGVKGYANWHSFGGGIGFYF